MTLAERVGKVLVVRDVDGEVRPPGAGPAVRLREPDGSDVVAVARGDQFDLYFGKSVVTNVPLTSRTAVRLGLFLVWWWARHAWFGLKPRLWRWVQDSRMERRWRDGERTTSK